MCAVRPVQPFSRRLPLLAPALANILAFQILAAPALAAPKPTTEPWSMHVVAPNPVGLIGWWTGDGDALDSLGHNDARFYGAVAYVAGMVGQAFYLDGQSSFVKSSTSDLNPGQSQGQVKAQGFTLEMWINPDDLAQMRPLAGWSTTLKPGVSMWIEPAQAGTPALLGADLRDANGGSHRLLSETGSIVAGKWQHVALTYDRATSRGSLYVDGKLVGEKNIDDLEAQTSLDFCIGKHASIGGGHIMFKGAIDEVSVFSRGLTLAEVQAICQAGSAGKQLLSDNDSTLTQAQRWQATQKRLASFAAKHGGQAMSFASNIDGSDLVHIQADKVWFVHRSWELPGKHGGSNQPTRVNGDEWFPNWDGNNSDKDTLTSPLPREGELSFSIDALKLGGDTLPRGLNTNITLVQKPTAANNEEAILLLDDDQDGGPHWFVFSMAWGKVGTEP